VGQKNHQTTISEVLTPTKYEVTKRRNRILKKIYLLLCDSCFWTASYIYNLYNYEKIVLSNCPMCDKPAKSLLVSSNNKDNKLTRCPIISFIKTSSYIKYQKQMRRNTGHHICQYTTFPIELYYFQHRLS